MRPLMKFLLAVSVVLGCAVSSWAQNIRLSGWCENGNVATVIPGTQGSGNQKFQQSYPSCTVTIYNAGTLTLSTIYSDAAGDAKANPFTAATSGQWFFYGPTGLHYDVNLSGGGIPVPFTLGDYAIPATACSYSSSTYLLCEYPAQTADIFVDNAHDNVAMGGTALFRATASATFNVAIGQNALSSTSGGSFVGSDNTAVGMNAMAAPTGAFDNTAIGFNALTALNVASGGSNTAVGSSALAALTTGENETAVGYQSLLLDTAGVANTAIGLFVLTTLTSGYNNTFVGGISGTNVVTGHDNTGIGYQSGCEILTAATYNTFLGSNAGCGDGSATLSGDIFIGAYAGRKELGSNILLVDNISRSVSQTDSRNKAILWGQMAALPANQILNVNALLDVYGATVTFASGTANGSAVVFTANSGAGFTTMQSAAAGAGTINPLMLETPGLSQYFAMNQSKPGQAIPAADTKAWMFEGLDGSLTSLVVDGYGTAPRASIIGRKARGTAAVPAAIGVSNETLFSIEAYGYGATGYSTTGRASMNFLSTQAWTDTAQGAYVTWSSTTSGAVTQVQHMTMEDGLIVGYNGGGGPTGGDEGDGTINVSGGVFKNGTAYTNPDYVLEKLFTGRIEAFADHAGADRYVALSLDQIKDFASKHYYLPQLDFFNAHGSASDIFDRADISLILHEDTFRFLFEQQDRIRNLESRLQALERK
jgi:hypothetical protein